MIPSMTIKLLKLNENVKKHFKNKTILVTGGTGSIGLGLIKQLTLLKPKQIRIFSNDENSIVEIKEIIGINKIYQFMVGDVRDKERLQLAIRNVDIVFHAAAMKQVPATEYNPFEAVKTNIFGAKNIIESCINAFEHSKTKEIFIHFIVEPDKLTVKVIDKGVGFDKSKVEIPNIENKLNSDERKRGWGLQLVSELMDSVEYNSDESGTTVTMTKKRDNE